MGVRDQLALLGTDLGQFNQGTFKGTREQIEGIDLSGGYCGGICLDWARRVLQRDPVQGDQTYLTYGGQDSKLSKSRPPETRQTETLRRMATLYKEQAPSYVASTHESYVLARLSQLKPQGDRVSVPADVAKLLLTVIDVDSTAFNLQADVAAVVSTRQMAYWIHVIKSEPDAQHSARAAAGREWAPYARTLDERFTDSKSRKFGNLSVVASIAQQIYGTPGAWIVKLRQEAFVDGGCTVINAGPPTADGHTVAVHQLGPEYRFFDPNYGVFRYDVTSLGRALLYLFHGSLFPDETCLDKELPVYQRRDNASQPPRTTPWTRMGCTTFKANVG